MILVAQLYMIDLQVCDGISITTNNGETAVLNSQLLPLLFHLWLSHVIITLPGWCEHIKKLSVWRSMKIVTKGARNDFIVIKEIKKNIKLRKY